MIYMKDGVIYTNPLDMGDFATHNPAHEQLMAAGYEAVEEAVVLEEDESDGQ